MDLSAFGDSNASAGGAVSTAFPVVFATASAGEGIAIVPLNSAWAGIGLLSDRDGLSSDTTTTEPAIAPIAAATTAMRAVRLKPGMGAK